MKLHLFNYQCANCKCVFKVPKLAAPQYGEFLLRSVGGSEAAYLNALKDPTYDEVHQLVKASAKMVHKSANMLADALRKIYGAVACDPSSAGGAYELAGSPKCPSCGRRNMAAWEATEPSEYVEKEVRPVTHSDWNQLSSEEKMHKVEVELSLLGY